MTTGYRNGILVLAIVSAIVTGSLASDDDDYPNTRTTVFVGPGSDQSSSASVSSPTVPLYENDQPTTRPVSDDEPTDESGFMEYNTRFGFGHDVGDGIGFDDSFSTFEWMIPLFEERDSSLTFVELRMILNNHSTVGANLGVAHRVYSPEWNRTFGGSAFYDFRDSGRHDFHQLGLGFETLGEFWDFRTNLYIPAITDAHKPTGNRFVGNTLLVGADVAMTGLDMEIGVPFASIGNLESRVFAGWYYFEGSDTEDVSGWRARSEVYLSDTLSVSVSAQDDDVFGSTFSVGIAWRFLQPLGSIPPQPQYAPIQSFRHERESVTAGPVWRRLAEPIRRLRNIVITEQEFIARSATTGGPLPILHVVNGGAGDGSIEDPYGSFSDALADPRAATGIIYTPQGGTFTDDVDLIAGSTVLSNGPIQVVSTNLGNQPLPFSGANTNLSNLPQIVGDVTLASNSILSGFQIDGAVSATAISNFSLVMGRIVDPTGLNNGITLMDVSGTANLSNLTIENSGMTGIAVTAVDDDLTLSLSDLTVASSENAIDIAITGSGNLELSLDRATVNSTNGTGIKLNGSLGSGDLTITSFSNNTVTGAAVDGVAMNTVTFDSDLSAAGNQQVNAGSLLIGSPLTVNDGVQSIVGVDTTNVTGDGLSLFNPTGDLSFTSLGISNDSGTGLLVDTKSGGTTFTLVTGSQSFINTTNGAAMNLDPLTVDMNFLLVNSINSTDTGITLDTVDGNLNILTTTITGSESGGISVLNTPNGLTADFGATTISRTQDMAVPADAVNVTNNVDTTITFLNLDINNSSGSGIVVDNSAVTADDVTVIVGRVGMEFEEIVFGIAETMITVTGGAALDINDATVLMNFLSLERTDDGLGINLENVAGGLKVGDGTAMSGGDFTHSQGNAIQLVNVSAVVTLSDLNVVGTGTALSAISISDTVAGANPSNLTVSNTVLTGSSENWIGINVFTQNGGDFSFTNNTLSGNTGMGQHGIDVEVNGIGAVATLVIANSTIMLDNAGTGINLNANIGLIDPLSGVGNTAVVGDNNIFDANGTDANINGTLTINGRVVFP